MITLNVRYEKSDKIPWRIIESEGVLVHIEKGEVIHLNSTAARIWRLIDGQKIVSEIIEELLSEYEISEEQLQHDTIDFLEQLLSRGIIRCVTS